MNTEEMQKEIDRLKKQLCKYSRMLIDAADEIIALKEEKEQHLDHIAKLEEDHTGQIYNPVDKTWRWF